MIEWIYLDRGSKKGPVSSDELRMLAGQGTVAPWMAIRKCDGDDQSAWRRAGEVKGLFSGDVSNQLGKAICASCGHSLDDSGQCVVCTPLPPPPPKASLPKPAAPAPEIFGNFSMESVEAFLGLLLMAGSAFLGFLSSSNHYRSRFASDNAIGAAANAMEAMHSAMNFWLVFFFGFSLVVLAKLSEIAKLLAKRG